MNTAVVYWLLDAEDNILYIGYTSQLRNRMLHHAGLQPWWPSVDSVAITDAMPHDVAIQVEREDISDLCPTHNVQMQTLIHYQPLILDPGFDIADHMTTSAAARALGVNVATVNRWAKRGDLPVALKVSGKVGPNLFRRSDIERAARDRRPAA